MDVLYHWQGINNNQYLTKVIRSVVTRTTSKIEDEGLVFASVITVLSGSGAMMENVDAEDRLRKALQPTFGYGNVPGNMIFLDQRRYEQEGCTWVPKTFLSQRSPSGMLFLPETEEEDRAQSWPSGLHVKYPGLLLRLPESSSSIPQHSTLRISNQPYHALICEAGTREFPMDLLTARSPLSHPALILPHFIKLKAPVFIAVLVDIIDWEDVQSLLSKKEEVTSSTKKTQLKANFWRLRRKLANTVWGFKVRRRALVHLTALNDEGTQTKKNTFHPYPTSCLPLQYRTNNDLVWDPQRWVLGVEHCLHNQNSGELRMHYKIICFIMKSYRSSIFLS